MSLRRLIFVLLLLIIVLLWKPSGAWTQSKVMWEQRDRFLRVAVVVLAIYMIYGFYQLYRQGGIQGIPSLSW